eukprot:4795638-Prymnesium_polylepis.4
MPSSRKCPAPSSQLLEAPRERFSRQTTFRFPLANCAALVRQHQRALAQLARVQQPIFAAGTAYRVQAERRVRRCFVRAERLL